MENMKFSDSQAIQNEKMMTLGMAASGIAHEINNLLTAVNSNIDINRKIISLLKAKSNITSDADSLDLISKLQGGNEISAMACERMIEIVKTIKNFSRTDTSELSLTDLHQCLDSTLLLLLNKYKSRVSIVKEYGDIPNIYANTNQLNQVFMNILANAVDAITDKGIITITTYTSHDYAYISIKDNGMGIPHENLNRIFETGFTTKEVGKGTGLGLSIVKKIIENHNGEIEAKSELEKGTEFIIKLPISSETFDN